MQRVRRGMRPGPALCSGFGLLEAIVALALLAGTGIALFTWINQNLDAASRLNFLENLASLGSGFTSSTRVTDRLETATTC